MNDTDAHAWRVQALQLQKQLTAANARLAICREALEQIAHHNAPTSHQKAAYYIVTRIAKEALGEKP